MKVYNSPFIQSSPTPSSFVDDVVQVFCVLFVRGRWTVPAFSPTRPICGQHRLAASFISAKQNVFFFKKSNNFLDRRHQNAELKNSGLNVDICMQSAYFMSPKPPKSPGSTSTPSSPTGLVFVTFCRECLDPSESVTPYRSQPPPFTNPDCQEKSDDYKTVSCFYSFFFQVSWSDLGSRPQQQLKLIQVTPGRVFWLNLDWMLQEGGQADVKMLKGKLFGVALSFTEKIAWWNYLMWWENVFF